MGKKWYLAGILEAFQVADEEIGTLYINWHLVRAANDEEAYTKALKIGDESNYEYLNTDGETVTVRFKGLNDLLEIHEELEDGNELFFDEFKDISIADIEAKARKKEELAVFRPRDWKKDLEE